MFTKLKQLFNVPMSMDKIDSDIQDLKEQMHVLSLTKKPTRYQELDVNKSITNYEDLKDNFERKYYNDALTKYGNLRGNLQECIIQYDKVLYYSKGSINFIELTSKIYELRILRRFILESLFSNSDVENFYLYLVTTNILNNTLKTIPYIDMEKVFTLTEIKKVNYDYYIQVDMSEENILIQTPLYKFEIDNRYRKTVLRTLYSIYVDKFYLYHLG